MMPFTRELFTTSTFNTSGNLIGSPLQSWVPFVDFSRCLHLFNQTFQRVTDHTEQQQQFQVLTELAKQHHQAKGPRGRRIFTQDHFLGHDQSQIIDMCKMTDAHGQTCLYVEYIRPDPNYPRQKQTHCTLLICTDSEKPQHTLQMFLCGTLTNSPGQTTHLSFSELMYRTAQDKVRGLSDEGITLDTAISALCYARSAIEQICHNLPINHAQNATWMETDPAPLEQAYTGYVLDPYPITPKFPGLT